jgi:hypothetical protein
MAWLYGPIGAGACLLKTTSCLLFVTKATITTLKQMIIPIF